MRRTLAAFLGASFALYGCGAAAPPPAKSGYARSPAAESAATGSAPPPDRDHDGIRDEEDAMPAEAQGSAPARGQLGYAPPSPAPAPPAAPGAPPAGQPATQPQAQTTALEPARDPSMIIYVARITMAVYQVDQGLTNVEKIARDQGGFLSLKRDREITIRVPRQRFEAALAAIDKVGDVLHRDIQAQDVTDEFVDLEIRIKNARAMQARLKTLLDKANVKEALEIEKELHRITEELERLEGRIKLLRDKIAYSTITVLFEARGSTIQATRIRLPFPWLSQLGLPNLLTLSEEKQP